MIALVAMILLGIYAIWGAMPDRRFTLANLRGLTPNQVVSRLGAPDVDPRLPKWGGWTPQNKYGELLVFSYVDKWRWRFFTYGVEFKNNQVVAVYVGEK